jgi:hypothetical protein
MNASDMFTGSNTPVNNFAQSNQLGIQIAWSSGGALTTGSTTFLQKTSVSGNANDSLMATQSSAGEWNGIDGTRTITWDFSKFMMRVTGFNGNNPAPFQQFLQAFATQITDLKIDFVQQVGDQSNDDNPDTISGTYPTTFFWDNVQLVPEPASLGGVALIGLLGLRRRR